MTVTGYDLVVKSLTLVLLVLVALPTMSVCAAGERDDDIDSPMYADPHLNEPSKVDRYHPRLQILMAEALGRPDIETRRRAAYTIGRLASMGVPGMDRLRGALSAMLREEGQHPMLRLEVARALVWMQARQEAPALLERSRRDGLDMIRLVDPALARWGHEPAYAMWMKRLADSATTRAVRIVAIQSLASVDHKDALPHLKQISLDRSLDLALRLEASKALGRIITQGLEADAESLLGHGMHDRSVAVAMLAHHEGPTAVALLRRLATDLEPAVASVALRKLIDINPLLVNDIVSSMCLRPRLAERHGGPLSNLRALADDPIIRQLAAEAIVAQHAPEAVQLLGPMLDDDHPDVRRYVRRQLVRMGLDAKLTRWVRHEGIRMLHLDEMDHWRGVAQAALLLGTLDHEAEAPRLIELFVATSSEVRLAAAVGLRRLAVDETLPQIFAMTDLICQGIKIDMYNRLLTDGRAQGNPKSIDDHVRAAVKDVLTDTLAKQVAQSMQMFGQMRYRKAEPLMRLHIPKHSYPVVQRAAAIWALGHLYDGAVNEDLSAKFAGRLSDINPMDPEALPVRRFSAVGIGRMKTTSQTAVLDRFYHEDSYSADVGGACRWALMHLDGQQRPPLSPIYTRQGGYFLEPDDELEDDQYLEVAR